MFVSQDDAVENGGRVTIGPWMLAHFRGGSPRVAVLLPMEHATDDATRHKFRDDPMHSAAPVYEFMMDWTILGDIFKTGMIQSMHVAIVSVAADAIPDSVEVVGVMKGDMEQIFPVGPKRGRARASNVFDTAVLDFVAGDVGMELLDSDDEGSSAASCQSDVDMEDKSMATRMYIGHRLNMYLLGFEHAQCKHR